MDLNFSYEETVFQQDLRRFLAEELPHEISDKVRTDGSRWVLFDIRVANQHDQTVATGQAMAEFSDIVVPRSA